MLSCAYAAGVDAAFGLITSAAVIERLLSKFLAPINATTGPLAISAVITAPVASSIKIAGIVQTAPLSPGAIFTSPGSLLIIITALAPACSA